MTPRRNPFRRAARRAVRRAVRPGRVIRRQIRRHTRRVIRRRTRRIIVGSFVLLALGGSAHSYKYRREDIDRMEQHTGKRVEDMTEEELMAAQRSTGVQTYDLDDEDIRRFDAVDDEDEDDVMTFGQPTANFCSNCGNKIAKSASFCPNCGAKV